MLFALVAFAAAGCHSYALADDVDTVWDLSPTPSDHLNTPYVIGATVGVRALGVDDDLEKFTVTSEDESVVRCVADGEGGSECTMVSPGTATLDLLKDGDVVHTSDVEVKIPTSATLTPRGPILVAASEDDVDPVTDARVLVGGTATFLVRYFADGELLSGTGALGVETKSGDAVGTATDLSFFESREWLQVSPTSQGPSVLTITADEHPVATFAIAGVPASAVADVALDRESESGAKDGDWLVVLANATDKDGEPIFGIDYDWDIDGDTQDGSGDLFRYEFDSREEQTLTATFNGSSSSISIHEQPGSGFVDSSNSACSMSNAPSSSRAVAMIAVALAAASLMRRRSRR